MSPASTARDAVRVLCFGGSTRPASSSELALRVAADAARRAGAHVEVLCSRELMFPVYDTETRDRTAAAQAFLRAVRRADGIVISSPGYHGAMSGMIKNALDYLEDLREADRVYLDGLPVGCVGVAYGWQATVSTLQGLRTVVHALRGWPTPLGAAVNASTQLFDAQGRCLDEAVRGQLETVARQVVEFASVRRAAAPAAALPVLEPIA